MKYKKKLDAKDFLYLVRGECFKGCSRCKFKIPEVDAATSEKLCVFRNFRAITDKSLGFIVSVAETFYR